VACMVKFMLLIASLFRQLPLVTRNHLWKIWYLLCYLSNIELPQIKWLVFN
jgi:hypothetical protein